MALGGPMGILGGPWDDPWRPLERTWGPLGVLGRVRGGPWGALETSRRVLGNPLEDLEVSRGVLGGSACILRILKY